MIDIINPVLCGLIAVRIATYSRNGAKYHLRHSLMAYFLALSAGGMALAILFDGTMVQPFQTLMLIVLCVSLFAVRGNVAELFRAG